MQIRLKRTGRRDLRQPVQVPDQDQTDRRDRARTRRRPRRSSRYRSSAASHSRDRARTRSSPPRSACPMRCVCARTRLSSGAVRDRPVVKHVRPDGEPPGTPEGPAVLRRISIQHVKESHPDALILRTSRPAPGFQLRSLSRCRAWVGLVVVGAIAVAARRPGTGDGRAESAADHDRHPARRSRRRVRLRRGADAGDRRARGARRAVHARLCDGPDHAAVAREHDDRPLPAGPRRAAQRDAGRSRACRRSRSARRGRASRPARSSARFRSTAVSA